MAHNWSPPVIRHNRVLLLMELHKNIGSDPRTPLEPLARKLTTCMGKGIKLPAHSFPVNNLRLSLLKNIKNPWKELFANSYK